VPVLLVWCGTLGAQEPSAPAVSDATSHLVLSLPECVQIALEQNLLLRVSWNETGLAASAARIEEASFSPWLTLAASHTETVISEQRDFLGFHRDLPDEDLSRMAASFVRSFRHGGIFSLTADLTHSDDSYLDGYELPRWGHGVRAAYELPVLEGFGMDVTTANLRRSEIDHHRSLLQYERDVKDLIVDVVSGYYSVQRSLLLIDEREEALERAKEQLRAAKIREEEGEVAPLDVFRSELQVRRSEPPVILTRNALNTGLNSLRLLIGVDPSLTIEVPPDEVAYATEETDMEGARQSALTSRLDLKIAGLDVEDAEIDYTVSRNALLPSLSLAAGANFQDYDDDLEHVFTYADSNVGVGVFFSVPLGGGRIGDLERYRRAKLALKNGQLFYEQKRREVVTEVEDAVRLARTLEADVASLKRAVDVAQQTYEMSQVSYEGGLISAFDLSQAQENLTFARTQWVEEVIDYLIAVAELDLAMGRSVDQLLQRILGPDATWTPPSTEEEPLAE
jgi:outer membrane protein TolC